MRFSDLVRLVLAFDGTLKRNTVTGNVWNLDQKCPEEVYKPSRGLFRLTKYRDETPDAPVDTTVPPVSKVQEQDFYEPFADWLVTDLEECTKAIPLGGSVLNDKWGTPDVIGKWESQRSDIVQAPPGNHLCGNQDRFLPADHRVRASVRLPVVQPSHLSRRAAAVIPG